jgi:hypothetical protein
MITPKNIVIGTLLLVIVVLLLRNVNAFTEIIKTVTDIFGRTFKAVTEVGDFSVDKK